ncbi:MAG: ABC transporter ATP-binding protein, partial [Acutalibacteraceae bacterium]
HICGLIGPNGAGKTTIMKILAGLAEKDSGDVLFFGDSEYLDKNRSRMSFMIENPMLDGNMTARQNLEYVRYVRGVASKKRIDEVLDFVELEDNNKKVSKYSLGMKQRLAIAVSLLSSPEVMVLDEPINGVDPEGIVDIRKMLQKLSTEQNVTILISSHILSEMAELCTDFAIICGGRLVEELSASELAVKCRNHISLKTDNISKTTVVLEEKLHITNYKVLHSDEIHIYERIGEIPLISKTVTESGLIITKLSNDGGNLEEYYLSKVGGSK